MRNVRGVGTLLLLSLLMVYSLGATGELPAMPIQTIDEAFRTAQQVGELGGCGTMVITGVLFVVQGVPYILQFGGQRFVIADNRDGDTTPVWLGRVEEKRLIATQFMTYADAIQRYPRACDFFQAPSGEGG